MHPNSQCYIVTLRKPCHIEFMLFMSLKKWSWDGLGLSIAGLCLVHCLATTILLAFLATAGGILVDPIVHEVGLALAIVFGLLALGKGVLQHNFIMPAAIGALGIGIMAGALTLPHSDIEIMYTILGVGILALGHDLNVRAAR
jgi:MerC mercury resistance protein